MSKNIVERYLVLKNKYRNYDTKYALKRMQAFRLATQELSRKGYEVALELLGSINFGIVDPTSDVDCILLLECDLHKDQSCCPTHCTNLSFVKTEISKFVLKRLSPETFNIDYLDTINLKYVEEKIRTESVLGDETLYCLLFYRNIGRPVNRPLFIPFCDQLEENHDFVKEIIPWAADALEGYLNTNQHRMSFNKYNERIRARGLSLPEGLQQELQAYMEGKT
ncbi:hypothetical protein ND861_15795 [Leptospira sp. 2 VSF19]|uniref:Polymerase nucleotidyl transferase domain-containing protein n=1 Tax=Leptospira soteropolitanensis TaxID=2950025 RepID=A0AAW5VFH3_9LEPT|nr:hypothetical protein [Leptospira soteropolitanensis]MCW7494110.1 hypothetical protein [Leptospira soteropolitanensis]MCW7501624.1 hypothetical protein [Leptospira soteropolitanensis]MCW7523956.1 hypothetical protein [Leptospira soteropolitanensis]MCW7527821.1 hypothetical protein [Leptospira soteropolitanensis]MCW7531594.1 hypothetical protein [Leptospira soteropolitanensis]